jgi:general secretion pathway protein B
MSYILEALKKSEKERKKEGVPDLQADHSLPPAHKSEREPFVVKWLARGVVFLLLGGGVWFWWSGQNRTLPQLAQELEVFSPSPAPLSLETSQVSIPLNPGPDSADELQENPVHSSQEINLEIPESQPLKEDNPETVLPRLEELPAELRKKIPELSFVGHVYADDPEKRLIMINNRIVREGDQVSNGLSLQQITRDGVIIRYEVYVFQVKLF